MDGRKKHHRLCRYGWIKGMIVFRFCQDNTAEVMGVAVHPAYRLQGIGSELIRQVAKEYGIEKIVAETDEQSGTVLPKNQFQTEKNRTKIFQKRSFVIFIHGDVTEGSRKEEEGFYSKSFPLSQQHKTQIPGNPGDYERRGRTDLTAHRDNAVWDFCEPLWQSLSFLCGSAVHDPGKHDFQTALRKFLRQFSTFFTDGARPKAAIGYELPLRCRR